MEEAKPQNDRPNSQNSAIRYRADVLSHLLPDQPIPLSSKALALLQASRAATGFDSYCAYLDYHGEDSPQLKTLSAALKNGVEPNARRRWLYGLPTWSGSVLSISKCRTDPVTQDHQLSKQGTEIIETLCHPPENACLQIVLWNILYKDDIRSQDDLVDFLGLRYRLDPRIFEALLDVAYLADAPTTQRYRLDRYKPTHLRAGNTIVAFCSARNDHDALPVVLIMGPLDKTYGLQEEDSTDQFGACPPLSPSRDLGIDDLIPSVGTYRYYLQLLTPLLEQYHEVKQDDIDLPSICVLPLLQLSLFALRCDGRFLRELFDSRRDMVSDDRPGQEAQDDSLNNFRTRLRMRIVDAENDWYRFVKHMNTHFRQSFLAMSCYQDYEDELKKDVAEADRLESQVRDYMQIQVARLSLQESRNSIEMSNRQMEESKRVKIFTILAFVYVPLNLATSIYGMNLQQLNGSGQSLRKFILTALIALIITGSTWYFVEVVNSYRNWQDKRTRRATDVPAPEYSIIERVAMIIWLVREGHWTWMTKTGAWSRILRNSNKPFRAFYPHSTFLISVGDLVSKHSLGEFGFSFSELEKCMPDEMLPDEY